LATGAGIAGWQVLDDQEASTPEPDVPASPEAPTGSTGATGAGTEPPSPTAQVTEIVGDEGFDIVLGRVRVSAPAGVAESGTPVTVSIPEGPAPPEVSALATLIGQPISVVLGNEIQPDQPVTIQFDLGGSDVAASRSESNQLVVISTSGPPETLAVTTGTWDPQTEILTLTTDHLTGFWAAFFDVGKYILGAIQGFLGLTYSQPERAFEPLSIRGRSYSVAHSNSDPIWPLLVNEGGQLAVELHSNSNMSWAIASAPAVSGDVVGGWKDLNAGIAAIYQGLFDILGQERAALMPGGLVRLPFDAADTSIRIEARQSPILFNVTMILQAVISVLHALPTGRVAEAVLESFSAFDCITEVINTFYQDETAEISRSIVLSILSCVGAMIEEQATDSNIIVRTALAAIGMLSVAANTIVGAAQGIWREITGTSLVAYTITAETPSSGVDQPATAAVGPGLDAPIAVKWRFEQLGPVYDPPTIDRATLFVAKQGSVNALDLASGAQQWITHDIYEQPATPIAFDDLIIVSSVQRSGCRIQAFDRYSGDEQWRIGDAGLLFGNFALANGRGWFSKDETLYTFDPLTGDDHQEIHPKIVGSPVASDGMVFAYGYMTDPVRGSLLVGFDAATGTRTWSLPGFPGLTRLSAASNTVFAGATDGYFHALEALDGSTRWKILATDRVWSKPSVSNGLVFIDAEGSLNAFDLQTGARQWTFSSTPDRVISAQAVAGDLVYAASLDHLFALDARTGAEYWRYPIGNMVGGPDIAVGEGVVCAVYDSTNIVAFGNVQPMKLITDATIRGAPSETAVERGRAAIGDPVVYLGTQVARGSVTWLDVSINGVSGWIPLDSIDSSTMPPTGDIEYVYVPG
jgi:outer membrane protein assembly factor BamB